MPRIVPSQIVNLIESSFPAEVAGTKSLMVDSGVAGQFKAVLRLIDDLPPELLTIGGKEFANFIANVEHFRGHLDLCLSNQGTQRIIGGFPGSSDNPIQVLRAYLKLCPDEIRIKPSVQAT
jgi:hypothetical protein